MHHTHFLLSAKARTLSMREVFAMSDDQAFEAFREVRWGGDGEPECPACGVVAGHWFLPSRRQWRCRDCGHTFSVTSGTIFAHHKLPLQVYLGAIAIYTNAVKGLSALQLSRDLDVQYKTAFVLMHKLRQSLMDQRDETPLAGEVQGRRGLCRWLGTPRQPGRGAGGSASGRTSEPRQALCSGDARDLPGG